MKQRSQFEDCILICYNKTKNYICQYTLQLPNELTYKKDLGDVKHKNEIQKNLTF